MTNEATYYSADFAEPTLNVRVVRTAAKIHRCDQCGGEIAAKVEYTLHSVKVEGDFHTLRYHRNGGCRF